MTIENFDDNDNDIYGRMKMEDAKIINGVMVCGEHG